MTTTDHELDDRRAPDPEHPDKPDTPREIEKRSWKYVFVKTAREFTSDECTDIAAALTYYAVLAIFPGLVAVFSIFGLVGRSSQATDQIIGVVDTVAPDAADALRGPLEQAADSPAAGWGLILGLVLAIWSASGYVGAFSRAMNRIYEIEEGRPFWKLKPAQILITLIGVALIVVALVILVVSGPVADAVGSALGLGEVATTVWDIVKWPVLAAIVVLMVAILYYATPNAKQPKFRWISLGSLLAIWSASGYVGAFSRAMNRIYEIEEGRPFWKLKPAQILITLIGVALIVVALVILVVSGPVADAVGSALGLGEVATTAWEIAKWPVLAAIVVLMVAILYYATPNAKQPKFRWISLGSLLAILVLVVASVAFGLYVANFSNYDRTYGSLAGVIIFLLWLWIANIALLFGAEFDAELERGRQLQAGIAAEEDIQLPPRDTRKSDKAAEKERHDVEEGRRIREEHDDDDADATSEDKTSSRRQG